MKFSKIQTTPEKEKGKRKEKKESPKIVEKKPNLDSID